MQEQVVVSFRAPIELDRQLRIEAAKRRVTKTAVLLDAARLLLERGDGAGDGGQEKAKGAGDDR